MAAREQKATLSNNAAPVFAALGDPVRLAIVARLSASGRLPTIALKQGTELSRQAVTKHLKVLEEAGLVDSDRVGRDRLWQVRGRQVEEARRFLERISTRWDARLARLRAFVEDEDQ